MSGSSNNQPSCRERERERETKTETEAVLCILDDEEVDEGGSGVSRSYLERLDRVESADDSYESRGLLLLLLLLPPPRELNEERSSISPSSRSWREYAGGCGSCNGRCNTGAWTRDGIDE
jgi:hypothetical protein